MLGFEAAGCNSYMLLCPVEYDLEVFASERWVYINLSSLLFPFIHPHRPKRIPKIALSRANVEYSALLFSKHRGSQVHVVGSKTLDPNPWR
jgi:hypothetical protein